MTDHVTPAFPIPLNSGQSWQGMSPCDGMTMRDYFAAKALTSPVCLELSSTNNWDNETRARWAYVQADEMLKARQE